MFINVDWAERDILSSFDGWFWRGCDDRNVFTTNDNVPRADFGAIDKDLAPFDELREPRPRQIGLSLGERGVKPKSPKALV